MKLFKMKFPLALLIMFVSVMAVAQDTDTQPQKSSELFKTDVIDVFTISLSRELFEPTMFQTTFNQSQILSESGVFLNESKWNFQEFLNDEDIQKAPFNRFGVTRLLQGGFDAGNFGSQTFRTYNLGKSKFRQINTFDFSGNLNQSTLQIEF